MNSKANFLKTASLIFLLCVTVMAYAVESPRYYYQLKIYHLKSKAQEERLDAYLQNAYLPGLHKAGIKNVGVFKPIEQDTADKKIYVLVPFKTWDQLENTDARLLTDAEFTAAGKGYIDAPYDNIPYNRIETIILKAFPKMLSPEVPKLKGNKADRVYELRSYEGPTEKYYVNKVHMFNDGDEVGLFKRLNFNAVFYAEVIAGSHMPNLMYMTTFNNKQDRDKHWDAFSNDPQWKALIGDPQYAHNVSKADILFLHPTEYSDF